MSRNGYLKFRLQYLNLDTTRILCSRGGVVLTTQRQIGSLPLTRGLECVEPGRRLPHIIRPGWLFIGGWRYVLRWRWFTRFDSDFCGMYLTSWSRCLVTRQRKDSHVIALLFMGCYNCAWKTIRRMRCLNGLGITDSPFIKILAERWLSLKFLGRVPTRCLLCSSYSWLILHLLVPLAKTENGSSSTISIAEAGRPRMAVSDRSENLEFRVRSMSEGEGKQI